MDYLIRLSGTQGRKICVDPGEAEAIYLYPGEIRKWNITDGMQVTKEWFEALRQETALPRARKRAMAIISKRDKTEQELRDKLTQSMNDSRSVEEAISFMKDNGYIDDRRYASEYLLYKRKKKSFLRIRMDLKAKGIPEEILSLLFEEEGKQEAEDLVPLFDKYIRRFPVFDREAAGRTYAHFARKGYRGSLISSLIREAMAAEEGS